MKRFVMGVLMSSLSVVVFAQDAHQHGQAQLNLVIDGPLIDMELVSPSINILGFEHEVKTESDQKILKQAQDTLLLKGELLFAFTDEADCMPIEVSLESAGIDELLEDEHHHTEGMHHMEERHYMEEHSDIHVHYVYSCNKPAKLAGMKAQLFNKFPGMDELNVHVLNGDKQFSKHLVKHHSALEF